MSGVLGAYRRVNDALEAAIVWLSVTLVAIIVLTPFLAAVTRYLTGQGYDWLAELPPQLVPWVVFPMVGVVFRRERHIAVDLLPHFLHGAALNLVRILVMAASLAACLVFTVFGVNAVAFFARLGQVSTTEIEFELWLLYLSYPIGFLLAANFCAEGLLHHLAGNVEPVRAEPEMQSFIQ